jgi:hypothetical protein
MLAPVEAPEVLVGFEGLGWLVLQSESGNLDEVGHSKNFLRNSYDHSYDEKRCTVLGSAQ